MSGNTGDLATEVGRRAVREAVREGFEGVEPFRAESVAESVGATVPAVDGPLREMVAEGELSSKDVGEETVYYRTDDDALDSAALPEGQVDVGAALDVAVAHADVPGTSEMMVDWRRDALRAAAEHLRKVGSDDAAGIRTTVYSRHSAGYDDRTAWWRMVEPRLANLPGVSAPANRESGRWRFDPDEI